jgi:hypothetical protein
LDCCSERNSDEFHFRIENKFFLFEKHLTLNLQMLDYFNFNLFLAYRKITVTPMVIVSECSQDYSLYILQGIKLKRGK